MNKYQYIRFRKVKRTKTKKPKPKTLCDHAFVFYYLPIKIGILCGHKRVWERDFISSPPWKEVKTVSNDEKRNVGYLKPKSKPLVLLF